MDTKLKDFFSDLITASHILHYHGVVDGYGHISARNPENHSTFFMARSLAPGLVESLDDLVEYYVNDGEPVRSDAPRGFLERQIHSQALKKYPTVMSVVHSHSPETIPFSITNVRMRACTSLAGFVGQNVPKFDTADYYRPDDNLPHDLMIRSSYQGEKLASYFADPDPSAQQPANAVVLMVAHGFATIAPSIETAVFQAIYTQANAKILASAMTLQNTCVNSASGPEDGSRHLSLQEIEDIRKNAIATCQRPWEQWKREVEVSSMYRNSLNSNYVNGSN